MYLGIDIGGTNLKAGLVDNDGTLIATKKTALGKVKDGDVFCEKLAFLCHALLEENSISRKEIPYVGIGIPSAVSDKTGVIPRITNIDIGEFPIRELFSRYWDVPLVLGNDAVCAAWGEYLFGAGRNSESFVIVTIGTGIGGGIILNGKAFLSTNGVAGEVGHMVIVPEGDQCNCGRKGCWERYASASALIQMTKDAMAMDPESLLWEFCDGDQDYVDGRTAFNAAERGDEAALKVCHDFRSYLSLGILNIINILQPEVIALGGGVSHESDHALFDPLRKMVEGKSLAVLGGVDAARIVRAELGNDAGIIGAAFLGESM